MEVIAKERRGLLSYSEGCCREPPSLFRLDTRNNLLIPRNIGLNYTLNSSELDLWRFCLGRETDLKCRNLSPLSAVRILYIGQVAAIQGKSVTLCSG